jgi:hypothetical protein
MCHILNSQDGAPNERKIMKLCEYAAKNPMRIPKACDVAVLLRFVVLLKCWCIPLEGCV